MPAISRFSLIFFSLNKSSFCSGGIIGAVCAPPCLAHPIREKVNEKKKQKQKQKKKKKTKKKKKKKKLILHKLNYFL